MAPPSRSDSAVDAAFVPVSQPTKLFIGGITKSTTTKQLREHFQQFGRVLDCIAMRQADGRSRGFGYVTLDSRAAAEKCLTAAQVVDNRVVDVKLAVPEGTSMSSAPTTPMSASSPPFTPVGCGGMWGDVYHGATGANAFGFDSMWGYTAPSLGLDFVDLSSFEQPQVYADADFSPPVRAEPMSVTSTLLENDRNAINKAALREPRRALGDITNKKGDASDGKKLASASDLTEAPMPCKSTKQDTESLSADTGVKLQDKPVSTGIEDLPSVGSALHASGECHRCNFFSKGRCSNGRDCSFCHFEHEKRKVSRQEKRERREKWLAQQATQDEYGAGSESGSQDSMQSDSLQQVPAKMLDGSVAPPGLSLLKPAAGLGEHTPSNMPLVPPGAFLPRFQVTSPSGTLSSLRPPPLQLLSTTPSPMCTPLAASAPLEHAFVAAPGLRVTVATQTEPEPCELCGRCDAHAHCGSVLVEGVGFADEGEAKTTWAKEELLRLRSRTSEAPEWRLSTLPTDCT